MFDIFYQGENKLLLEYFPFAEQVDSTDKINPDTRMYWFVEPNVKITDYSVFEFRPPEYDWVYEHVWKWNDANYGGLRLLPSRQKPNGIKHVNQIVCKKSFDILLQLDPADYFNHNPYANYVWCVDPEYQVSEEIDWAPGEFEPDFIHSFHLKGQLEHKYPAEEGGIKLYPRNWKKCSIKFHGYLDANKRYPVLYVSDVNNYAQREALNDEYVWLIDYEHQINEETLDWVPNPFENKMIHSFRMPYHLRHKYPEKMGGIRLVPREWKNADTKIHEYAPAEIKQFDVFYVDHTQFNSGTYSDLAARSKTEWFWAVDREYEFNAKLLYLPEEFDQQYIHVFKIPGQLEYRYDPEITNPHDNRCGGVRLINKNYDITQQKYFPDVVPARYEVFFAEDFKNFQKYADIARTEMFWLIDSRYQISDKIDFLPERHEQNYILNFKVSGQLEHIYPEKEGGISLVPKTVTLDTDIKYKGSITPRSIEFPVKRVYDVNDLSVVTEDCWLIDARYEIDENIEWIPNDFQKNCIHTFHIQGQLKEFYPDDMGGARWVPVEWNGEYVIHDLLPIKERKYPVHTVDNVGAFVEFGGPCWVIDSEYLIETDNINWLPEYHEKEFLHVFHIPGQLRHKYPEEMGGVYWVPENWAGEIKIHEYLPVKNKNFDIHLVKNPETQHKELNGPCWVIDQEYQINTDNIDWVPEVFERQLVHVFHIPGQLRHKYPEEMGGVYWVPENWAGEIKIHDSLSVANKTFDIHKATDPASEFEQVTGPCWVIDQEYQIENTANWIPEYHEKEFLHVFHVPGQLRHKYPEEMGGVYWVPENWAGEIKIHEDPAPFKSTVFEIFTSEAEGRAKCTHDWFWVVDPHVTVNDDFDFGFLPDSWDFGKTHVWQKINPVTGRQYDYAGVMLCPKKPQEKGRPKYIRETGCTQNTFPVYHLENNKDIIDQLAQFDEQTENTMYWVVDADVKIRDDFLFDYYPTQWDIHNVHAFLDHNNQLKGVRLYPKHTFDDMVYTQEDVEFCSFDALKKMNTVATEPQLWPVLNLTEFSAKQVDQFSKKCKKQGYAYFWVVDPDVTVNQSVLDAEFLPIEKQRENIHVWQRLQPVSNRVHSYGGLRLWPTSIDNSELSDSILELNKIKNISYVKEPGSTYKQFDVVFISYHEPYAASAYKRLCAKVDAKWVKDVTGIFQAHKEAAKQSSTKMFWVVDADAHILDDFDFSYIPNVYDHDVVHVWNSVNPVTGLEYGYGGVKLFNREQVLNAASWGLDFTTGLSDRFKVMPEVSCITGFNTDSFNTWRSAFRECVKLTLNDDKESQDRLKAWLQPVADADFAHDAKTGAKQGKAFATKNKNKPAELAKINDYEWLKNTYESTQLELS